MVLSYSIRSFGIVSCILAAGMICNADGDHPLHIKIPKELDHTKAMVQVYQSGQSKLADWNESSGFTSKVSDPKMVRVLIYYPGYRLMSLEYVKDDMQREMVFEPEFVKLPRVPINIRVVDSSGKPVPNRKISITRIGASLALFKEKSIHIPVEESVIQGVSNAEGLMSLELPDMLDDPIFTKYCDNLPIYRLSNEGVLNDVFGSSLVPVTFTARKTYEDPLIIKNIWRGGLMGKVEASFLERNGIIRQSNRLVDKKTGKIRYVFFVAKERSAALAHYVEPRNEDGSFLIVPEPGTYAVKVEIRDEKHAALKTIPLEQGFTIAEKEKKEYTVK